MNSIHKKVILFACVCSYGALV